VDFRHYIFDNFGVTGDLEAEVCEELGGHLALLSQKHTDIFTFPSQPDNLLFGTTCPVFPAFLRSSLEPLMACYGKLFFADDQTAELGLNE